jgi:hypothetical protein
MNEFTFSSESLDGREPLLVAENSASFREFSLWLDGELDLLVAKWKHAASPSAQHADEVSARRKSVVEKHAK